MSSIRFRERTRVWMRGRWDLIVFFVWMTWKLVWFDHVSGTDFYVMTSTEFWSRAFKASLQGNWHEWVHSVDLISACTIIFLSAWTIWLKRWARIWTLLSLDVFITAIIISDLIYYRYFNDFITVPVLLQSGQVSALGASIASLFHLSDLFLLADVPIWALYMWISSKKRRTPNSDWSKHTRRSLISFTVAAYLFSFAGIGITVYNGWMTKILQNNWWTISMYNTIGLLGFHMYDTASYIYIHTRPIPKWTDVQLADANALLDPHELDREHGTALTGTAKGSNVIVIQIEALQNFIIGQSVNGEPITPNLDKLIQKSMYVPNYLHQTAQGRTSDADFISHCSMYPVMSGSVFMRAYESQFDCLPQVLKENGYHTTALHAFRPSFWNRDRMYPGMGFDEFLSENFFKMDEKVGWALGDRSLFKQGLAHLETVKQPFYAYFVTLSSHHPYRIQDEFRTFHQGPFENTMLGDYIQAVHYTDQAIGELIDRLKKDGLWNNTMILMYGDHDNSIEDIPAIERLIGKKMSHTDELFHWRNIPLIVHFPHDTNAGVVTHVAGQLDFAPSITDWLGIKTPNIPWFGQPMSSREEHANGMRSGEVFTDQTVFEPAPDRNVERGSCYLRKTSEKIALERCIHQVQLREREYVLSDDFVLNNRLSVYQEARHVSHK